MQKSKTRFVPLAALFLALILSASGRVDAQGVGVGLKAGSTGAGLDLTFGLTKSLNLRAGGQGFSITQTRTEFDTSYDAKAKLASGMLLFDLHPSGKGFRVSAGAYYSKNEVTAVSNEDTVVTLDGVAYPVSLVGQVGGKVAADEICPYFGLGWGNAVGSGGRVRFALDLGVFYQGRPAVTMTADPKVPGSVPAKFYTDLEAERVRIEEDLKDYKLYPVVSIGLTVKL
jgi:hypothetical protein